MAENNNEVFRVRLGIFLFVVSWLPIAQIILAVAHGNGKWTSDHDTRLVRLIVWTVQILIGLVSVWLAGQVVINEAKKDGLRHTPRKIWHLFWNGRY